MKAVKNKGLRVALIISCTLSVILFLVRGAVPAAIWHIARGQRTDGQCALWSVFAFPLIAVAKLFSSYFYAVGEDRLALFMIYADPCFFTPALLITLPLIFAIDGIWIGLAGGPGASGFKPAVPIQNS